MSFADTIFNWLPKLRRPDGTLADAQCDGDGSLRVSVVENRAVASTWVEPEPGAPLVHARVVTKTPGRVVRKVHVVNEGTETRWFMLFDVAQLPANGAQPTFACPVAPGGYMGVDVTRVFATGIAWGASSTRGTYQEDPTTLLFVSLQLS